MTLKESIINKAKELGFDLVGFCSAEPDTEAGALLHQWLSQGYYAGMQYMTRMPARRYQPALLLPDAKTVISLGINYYKYAKVEQQKPGQGKISLYAWGKDYHLVISRKLTQLAEHIKKISQGRANLRCYVDTGPLLERAFAQQAGLGFIGKNTTLITPQFGSWVFLAEIITELRLEPDEPKQSLCGDCALCLQACPTGALVKPYVLDATRCLSYHTVENRGDIPQGLRPLINGWLLGCDLCQAVCPFNQNRPETGVKEFLGEVTLNGILELGSIFNLDSAQAFKIKFRDTALWRPGFLAILRNAIIIAANHKQSQWTSYLESLLKSNYFKPLEGVIRWALIKLE